MPHRSFFLLYIQTNDSAAYIGHYAAMTLLNGPAITGAVEVSAGAVQDCLMMNVGAGQVPASAAQSLTP